ALGCAVGEDAGGGRGDLHRDLVGFEFQHGLVALDVVAVALEPRGDDTAGDGFADLWNLDGGRHGTCLRLLRPDDYAETVLGAGRATSPLGLPLPSDLLSDLPSGL